MKRILSIILSISFLGSSQAQKTFDHELQLAETRFALESQIHGLKWGFLHNMDTAALGLGRTGYNNLYKTWEARPDNAGFVLLWKPSIVFWSDDGLFGLTSGPFYTKSTPADSALSHNGYFFTIWQRANASAPFKIALDIGVNLGNPSPVDRTRDTEVRKLRIEQKTAHAQKMKLAMSSFAEFAKEAANRSLKESLIMYANNNSHLLVSGYGALVKGEVNNIKSLDKTFELSKTGMNRLGATCYYEWGTLRSTASQSNAPGYYVHVWTWESGAPVLLVGLYRID